jgi:hypothetical protein
MTEIAKAVSQRHFDACRYFGRNAMKITLSVIKADIAPVVAVVFIVIFIRVVSTGANGPTCAAFRTGRAIRP